MGHNEFGGCGGSPPEKKLQIYTQDYKRCHLSKKKLQPLPTIWEWRKKLQPPSVNGGKKPLSLMKKKLQPIPPPQFPDPPPGNINDHSLIAEC